MIFDLLGALEQRKIGGPQGPPHPWQGFSDVALTRVKNQIQNQVDQIGFKDRQDFRNF